MRRVLIAICLTLPTAALAEPVGITPDTMSVRIDTETGPVEISRVQDNANELSGEWARPSRPCPNFCIQPMSPAPGVTMIGELEMLAFLQDPDVVIVDGRVRKDFEGGAIPGAVNIP